MNSPLSRRTILLWLGTFLGSSLTGCTEPVGTPWRELSFGDVQATETDEEWVVTFELEKQYQAQDKYGTFHDVRVHGYDENGSEVCSKELGTIEKNYYGGDGLPIEMECSAFPKMLTYSAKESPCSEDISTQIHIAVYQDDRWLHDYYSRECGEGLPPEPRD